VNQGLLKKEDIPGDILEIIDTRIDFFSRNDEYETCIPITDMEPLPKTSLKPFPPKSTKTIEEPPEEQ
jgi:hypothetical protein